MPDVLYEKLIDECWDEISAIFDAPAVRDARRKFLRAVAAEVARHDGNGKGR